jgi:hypothetical protein
MVARRLNFVGGVRYGEHSRRVERRPNDMISMAETKTAAAQLAGGFARIRTACFAGTRFNAVA